MAGIFAKGTQLRYRTTPGSGAFDVIIANFKSTTGPTMRNEIFDTTTHNSSGVFREKTAGLVDAGDLSFAINFDPADASHSAAAGLLNMFSQRIENQYQIEFPNMGAVGAPGNSYWEFSAFVTQFEVSTPIDNVLEASISLTISDEPDFTQTVV